MVGLLIGCPPVPARATPAEPLHFESAEISTVVKHVGRLTGITFLFDPEQVKGRITILSPTSVSPEEALELLKSALAVHGYRLVSSAGGTLIVPAERLAPEPITVRVVALDYASAGEVAYTLRWVAPAGVRIVPYYPTNSLVISGPPAAVEKLIDIIK
jgi:general secretion pathway protein D